MEEEITESTVIRTKEQKGPSFLANVVTLGLLVGLIFAVQHWAKQRSLPFLLLEEDIDKEIVLEDLESQKPLVESESIRVQMPQENSKSETLNPKQTRNPKSEIQKAETDPYTSGGAMDLDRPENWDQYFPGRPKEGVIKQKVQKGKTEATATPTQRDPFIPFESE